VKGASNYGVPKKKGLIFLTSLFFNNVCSNLRLSLRDFLITIFFICFSFFRQPKFLKKKEKAIYEVQRLPKLLAFEKILQGEQDRYVRTMVIPKGVATNRSLRENLFMILVCVMTKLPIVLVGKPGNNFVQFLTSRKFFDKNFLKY
jgi:hypothetical protein